MGVGCTGTEETTFFKGNCSQLPTTIMNQTLECPVRGENILFLTFREINKTGKDKKPDSGWSVTSQLSFKKAPPKQ